MSRRRPAFQASVTIGRGPDPARVRAHLHTAVVGAVSLGLSIVSVILFLIGWVTLCTVLGIH